MTIKKQIEQFKYSRSRFYSTPKERLEFCDELDTLLRSVMEECCKIGCHYCKENSTPPMRVEKSEKERKHGESNLYWLHKGVLNKYAGSQGLAHRDWYRSTIASEYGDHICECSGIRRHFAWLEK